jgi:hypothetical protein
MSGFSASSNARLDRLEGITDVMPVTHARGCEHLVELS